jgi:siderophore synthetase component/RimJ/RimL family protein N-acetyltransferase
MPAPELPIGGFQLRPLRLPDDVEVIHDWVSQPYAKYWGLVGESPEVVLAAYRQITKSADVYLGLRDGSAAFLLECYDPGLHVVGRHYPVQQGDRGMHVLVAPPSTVTPGFTWSVFCAVLDFLFSDPATRRVVVEPDIRNFKIHALNRRAGFRYQRAIALPNKTAHLAFCTREDHERARSRRPDGARPGSVTSRLPHLNREAWASATRQLLCKALSELAHERLVHPELTASSGSARQRYSLSSPAGTQYLFSAQLLQLEHWAIEASSLHKLQQGAAAPLDAFDFFIEFQSQLGIPSALFPAYLEEIASTLYARAFKLTHQELSSADLVHADFQELEAAMSEGHPAFIANSGRVGFDIGDYEAYAPEAAAPVRLLWLAAHQRNARASTAEDLNYEQLLASELGAEELGRFRRELAQQGLDPSAYLFIPVHPWQWLNKLSSMFAADLATRDLVLLGQSADLYRPQQSIRTFFNLTHPERRYVKTALSVLNMGFMRGLSPDYMRGTPAINDWLRRLLDADPFFAAHGFDILREVAAIGYRNPRFDPVVATQSPYRKMLAALWRESPVPRLRPGQRLMTLAAVLHRDRDGHALLPQLIAASGVSIDRWLEQLANCYLAPLVHCLCCYGLAFMPHGENIILILERNVVVGVLLKDIAEETVLMDPARELPEEVRRIAAAVPQELQRLSIFTDIFDGIFRYLSQILLEQAAYPEERFWRQIAACVHNYRRENPATAPAFDRHELFAPEFRHSCLNRLQLRNNRQMIDLADPATALQFAGTLKNPIATVSRLHSPGS